MFNSELSLLSIICSHRIAIFGAAETAATSSGVTMRDVDNVVVVDF